MVDGDGMYTIARIVVHQPSLFPWRDRPTDTQARLVIVTGARPQVSTLLGQAGIKEEFRDDLRVTSKEALKVTTTACGLEYEP